MMLPSTLTLIAALPRPRPPPEARRRGFSRCCSRGYLLAWLGFGLLAHRPGARLLAAGAAQSSWLALERLGDRGGDPAAERAVPVLVAQEPLPERLPFADARSSSTIGRAAGQGGRAPRSAFAHGLYCIGCCWALMLIMFAVGTGSLAWMLLLAAVMAVEKNSPWGRATEPAAGRGADRRLPPPLPPERCCPCRAVDGAVALGGQAKEIGDQLPEGGSRSLGFTISPRSILPAPWPCAGWASRPADSVLRVSSFCRRPGASAVG